MKKLEIKGRTLWIKKDEKEYGIIIPLEAIEYIENLENQVTELLEACIHAQRIILQSGQKDDLTLDMLDELQQAIAKKEESEL